MGRRPANRSSARPRAVDAMRSPRCSGMEAPSSATCSATGRARRHHLPAWAWAWAWVPGSCGRQSAGSPKRSRSLPLDIRQALPEVRELQGQAPQLLDVERRQGGQPILPLRSEVQPDHPMVVFVARPTQQPCRLGSIHQLDGAVVAQQQLVGDVTDLGPTRITVSSDGKQQLVLGRGQPGRSCLSLAPMLEPPKASAKSQ